jgi:hypothetical protein
VLSKARLSLFFKTATSPEYFVFLGSIGVYMLASYLTARHYGLEDHFAPLLYLNIFVQASIGVLCLYMIYLIFRIIILLILQRPERPIAVIFDDWQKGPLRPGRFANALPIFTGFVFFFSAFTSMKGMIPGIVPYHWDGLFTDIDRIIHFGIDPWRATHFVFGNALITWCINIIYNFWLMAMFLVLYWQLFSLKDQVTRMQFFYAFILSWAINGTLLATLLSSVGPCFLELYNGNDYFRPLMDSLQQINQEHRLWALVNQEWLWGLSSEKKNMIGGGISAMPSMHVVVAFLYMLLALKLKVREKPLYIAFFIVILIGSVHLGWHYAIDGYVAIAATWIIWLGSGWLAKQVMVWSDIKIKTPGA